ncbi:MAG: glycosyltransferase, partial [Pseudomonadota bacterium]
SCRRWGHTPLLTRPKVTAIVATIVAIFAVFGTTAFAVLSIFALTTLCLIAGLKITGAVACMTAAVEPRNDTPPAPDGRPYRRPKVSVLVPLFREKEIAGRLISRLSKLTYPKVLLDVVLVLEEKDQVTREALEGTDLPAWMRVIEVPAHGGLTTKPRAMNYALDFCDGDIIGIWDAEDAPEPDQIDRAVSRFANAPQDVVCLQGVLDYYNPRTNWIARCFTIEYASWWRVILPGLARMGLVIPLGGTTLFFRRDKLEELGGWDAHNVTEDADLGVRLAREGYRTELFPAVTYEEANYRPWPWIKQRSRWLKGFMVTYLVHMRQPRQLWRDVGPRRFLGLQAFFIGTVSQFLLAPVLWSFWAIIFGAPHPVLNVIPSPAVWGLTFLFLFVEIANITIGMTAVSGAQHRHLMRWVPILLLYFPMGAVASYKALIELVVSPFYWDKTQHGQAEADEGTGIDDPMPPEQEY